MSLANKLSDERRARLAAERMLELKQAELSAANRKLGRHALALTKQIDATQAEVATVRHENERFKSDLSQAHEKIEIAERRLWHSIQTIEDGFAFFDSENKLLGANTAYVDFFDGLEEVTPGVSYMRILQLMTDEGLVDCGEMSPDDWRQMMTERWLSDSPEPVVVRMWNDQYIRMVDSRGPGGDVVSLALDITATVRYEESLRAERTRAEAANRAKSAFLANMSHEIRTPMNGVVGMAELLADTELDEEQQLYLSTIKNSGEALLVIINDVLDYSKIEADKLKLFSEPFDLERSVHEIVMLLQPAAREKGLTVALDCDVFLPKTLVGDAGRIRQVLTNLVGNAIKFTPEGHVLVRVTGVPEPESGKCSVHVTIQDTGIGIPPEKIDHIFGQFNQVDDEKNREFEGTGLGLAISKRLVEMMEGSVWVESEVGKGSCFGFRVTLPVGDDGVTDLAPLPPDLKRVLVVDDTEVNRQILEGQLGRLGIEVTCCASGAEALDAMSDSVDLVLTDHNMPGMDGLELAEALRVQGWTQVPIVLLSSGLAFAQNDPAFRHVQVSAQKPAPRAELIAKLAQAATMGIEPVEVAGESPDPEPALPVPEALDAEPEAAEPAPLEPVAEPVAPALEPSDTQPEKAEAEPAPPEEPVQEEIATPESLPSFASRRSRPTVAEPMEDPAEAAIPVAEDPDPALATEPSEDAQELPSETTAELSIPEPVDEVPLQTPETAPVQVEPEAILPEPEPEPEPEPVAELEAETDGERRMCVLAAEDNATNRLVLSKMIGGLNIDLHFAENGLEAVDLYRDLSPDLVLMDVSMPKMDGKQATAEIRNLENGSDVRVPIVAITAHAMTGDADDVLAAGMDHYMTKPLRKKELVQRIAEFRPEGALEL